MLFTKEWLAIERISLKTVRIVSFTMPANTGEAEVVKQNINDSCGYVVIDSFTFQGGNQVQMVFIGSGVSIQYYTGTAGDLIYMSLQPSEVINGLELGYGTILPGATSWVKDYFIIPFSPEFMPGGWQDA